MSYLMQNCFLTLGDHVYRQKIGIPMGSDPAPFMANLFLFHYESEYVKKIQKEDIFIARRFRHTFRFIDDLIAINDDGEFERCRGDIYPPELELKKEHSGNNVSFLDLNIDIKGRFFETSLYDKRDSFPFSIVRMPYKCSNMPLKIFKATIGGEILRIGRVSSNEEAFLNSARILLFRMKKQGANLKDLTNILKQLFGRHEELKKFAVNSAKFVASLL